MNLYYVLETNNTSSVYSVASILLLQFMVKVMLFPMLNLLHFYINTFRIMCAVPNKAVFCISVVDSLYFRMIWLLY
jgi:hypothetical protein